MQENVVPKCASPLIQSEPLHRVKKKEGRTKFQGLVWISRYLWIQVLTHWKRVPVFSVMGIDELASVYNVIAKRGCMFENHVFRSNKASGGIIGFISSKQKRYGSIYKNGKSGEVYALDQGIELILNFQLA